MPLILGCNITPNVLFVNINSLITRALYIKRRLHYVAGWSKSMGHVGAGVSSMVILGENFVRTVLNSARMEGCTAFFLLKVRMGTV